MRVGMELNLKRKICSQVGTEPTIFNFPGWCSYHWATVDILFSNLILNRSFKYYVTARIVCYTKQINCRTFFNTHILTHDAVFFRTHAFTVSCINSNRICSYSQHQFNVIVYERCIFNWRHENNSNITMKFRLMVSYRNWNWYNNY